MLTRTDPELAALIERERQFQQGRLDLVASENTSSAAQHEACGSLLVDVTVEGPVGARFLGTSAAIDAIEQLAIDRACRLFGANHANVQPHSGTQANQAALLALAKPGDTVLAMGLDAGGHFSHGGPASLAGLLFRPVFYGQLSYGQQTHGQQSADNHLPAEIDYDRVRRLAHAHRPAVLIAGGSAFPGTIDFARMAGIAGEVGAALLADIAHVAGLVACNLYPDPVPHAAVVTTTTGKNLGGAHGGLILTQDAAIAARVEAALCPVIQGTPLVNHIAAKAVAFHEAAQPAFARHQRRILAHADTLATTLRRRGIDVAGQAAVTPIVLLDLRRRRIRAAELARYLDHCGIGSTAVPLPGDSDFSAGHGLRVGVSALTSRGLDADAFARLGNALADAVQALSATAHGPLDAAPARAIRATVQDLTTRFPLNTANTD